MVQARYLYKSFDLTNNHCVIWAKLLFKLGEIEK